VRLYNISGSEGLGFFTAAQGHGTVTDEGGCACASLKSLGWGCGSKWRFVKGAWHKVGVGCEA